MVAFEGFNSPVGDRRGLLALRFLAAGIFLAAAFSKVFAFSGLLLTLTRLGWFPPSSLSALAVAVIVVELATGLLLLSSSTAFQRLGSIVGVGLSVIFIGVHLSLLGRGVNEVCSCLGLSFKQSPSFMLGLNALLFGACAAVFSQAEASSAQSAPLSKGLSARGKFARGAFCYALLMACALQAVRGREKPQNSVDEGLTPKLHYGQEAPDFALRLPAGEAVSPRTLSGKWTVLSFVSSGCEPCHQDLNELSRWYPAQKGKVNALTIVVGSGLLRSPEATARQFAQKMRLPMPVACDADQSVSKRYIGESPSTPFHVLMDGQGRVRMVQQGREEIEGGARSLLMEVLDSNINGVPLSANQRVMLNGGAAGQTARDGVVHIAGKEVRLSSLWRRGPLVLTFSVQDCHGCDERFATIERSLGASRGIQVLHVDAGAPAVRDGHDHPKRVGRNVLVGADVAGKLARTYGVQFAPATFVIAEGKVLHLANERASPFELERALAQLSTSSVREGRSSQGPQKRMTKETR